MVQHIQLYIHLISLLLHYVPPTGGPATLWAPEAEDMTFLGTLQYGPTNFQI